jgi:elongation factor G
MAVEKTRRFSSAYLDGKMPTVEELKRCIRKGATQFKFVPVMCGSAFKNKGVQPLLDAVVDYLPSPLDIPPVKGIVPGTDKEVERPADDKAPFAASRSRSWTTPSSAPSRSCASIPARSRRARAC